MGAPHASHRFMPLAPCRSAADRPLTQPELVGLSVERPYPAARVYSALKVAPSTLNVFPSGESVAWMGCPGSPFCTQEMSRPFADQVIGNDCGALPRRLTTAVPVPSALNVTWSSKLGLTHRPFTPTWLSTHFPANEWPGAARQPAARAIRSPVMIVSLRILSPH